MEILMDFNKPSISKKIEKFLLDNLKTEKEKESLINVTTGKSVLKGDAIALLITIVQAMTIVDEETKEEFDAIIPEDDGENDKDNGGTDKFPTLAQSMVKWSRVESKGKKLASAYYYHSFLYWHSFSLEKFQLKTKIVEL